MMLDLRSSILVVALVFGNQAPSAGQEPRPLEVQGGSPAGLRSSVTDSWGVVRIELTNPGPDPRDARVLVVYPSQLGIQSGRDLWVPGRSIRSAWVPLGPAPEARTSLGREIHTLLYDRTGGQNRLILPGEGEKIRSRLVLYRKRETTTSIVLDEPAATSVANEEVKLGVHAFRRAAAYPEAISVVNDLYLPPTMEAFDGVDHIVVAGNRLAADPAGRSALRSWVQQGGKLWIMLDRVEPATVAPILGEDFELDVVDRVSLTSVQLHRAVDPPGEIREFENPVGHVRVLPGEGDQVVHVVNGWPAAIIRKVGRGRVLITTLGTRAWHRPRQPRDGRSPYGNLPDLPVPLTALEVLAREMDLRPEPPAFTVEDLRPVLTEKIGYSVLDRRATAAILGAFVVMLMGAGVLLRRSGRAEWIGVAAPVAAVVAAGLFVTLGYAARRAVPPTVAAAAIVDAVPGSGDAAARGLVAVYRPDSGPVPLATGAGGLFDLDASGLEGQTRRRILTDLDSWHWEELALPAGVRSGPFQQTLQGAGIGAVARFGPEGVSGRLSAAGFDETADAVLLGPTRDALPARLQPDGQFTSGDPLPAGRYLIDAVLSDRQQRRQEIYRKYLGNLPVYLENREFLLAWARPTVLPVQTDVGSRTVGSSLLIVPLTFERPPPGTTIRVPEAFMPYRRISEGRALIPTLGSQFPVEQQIRFQVPASVLPLTIEKAMLVLRIQAASRRVAILGQADGRTVPLQEVESPTDAVRVEITDARLLRLDERGGLSVTIAVRGVAETAWVIESLGLEISGRTSDR